MKALKIIQMILLPLILLAGLAALFYFSAAPLRAVPNLHLNPGRIGLKTILLAAGCLLCLAFSLLCAIYTLFNLRMPIYKLLIPVVLFAVLGLGTWFCFTRAVKPLAYSYMTSFSKLDETRFETEQMELLPAVAKNYITGYARYDDGKYEAERVTVTYRSWDFSRERSRFEQSGLPSFAVNDWVCYELTEGGVLYQVQINRITRQVIYGRFVGAEQLPAVAPQPMEETIPAPTPEKTSATAETGSAPAPAPSAIEA